MSAAGWVGWATVAVVCRLHCAGARGRGCSLKRWPTPTLCVRAGEGEARGVEGQVQQLLADAQDPDKLCRMYIGWQSWV